MTRQLDLEQLLDTWLDDGPTDTADAVFDAAVARVYRQRQRPAWRVSWRNALVTTNLKLLIAAAAVIVIAVGGIALLGRPSTSPGNISVPPSASPSASPSPSPSPSTTPSASAVFPSWYPSQGSGAGILPAGSTTTRHFLAGSTFAVPEGWVNDGDYTPVYSLFPDTPANEAEYARSKVTAQNLLMTDTVENNMFAICDATGLFHGATAASVIDAVVANQALSATEPVDVTIDGLIGRQIDLQLSPDWTGRCPLNADDPPNRDYTDARNRLILLDSPLGRPIGIAIGSLYSSDFEAFLADAMPIVESLHFAFGPGASPSP